MCHFVLSLMWFNRKCIFFHKSWDFIVNIANRSEISKNSIKYMDSFDSFDQLKLCNFQRRFAKVLLSNTFIIYTNDIVCNVLGFVDTSMGFRTMYATAFVRGLEFRTETFTAFTGVILSILLSRWLLSPFNLILQGFVRYWISLLLNSEIFWSSYWIQLTL